MRGPVDERLGSDRVRGSRLMLRIRGWVNVDEASEWFTRNGWTVDFNTRHEKSFKKGGSTAVVFVHDVGSWGVVIGIR